MALEYNPASQEKALKAALRERGYAVQDATFVEDYHEATDAWIGDERAQLHLIHKEFYDFTQITITTWKNQGLRGEYAPMKHNNVKYLVFGRTLKGRLATVLVVSLRYAVRIYEQEYKAYKGDTSKFILWQHYQNSNGHRFIGLSLADAAADSRVDFSRLLIDKWSYGEGEHAAQLAALPRPDSTGLPVPAQDGARR